MAEVGADPRTPGADRRPDFYDRSENKLRCTECGQLIEEIPGDWLDARIRDSLPCPGCGLSSLIPTREEGLWPERKSPDDPMAGVSTVDEERLPR
jgi:hypothetical protein